MQRELVNKPVCDFQAPLVHHLWGRKTSSSVLGKDAEPQVCVRGGAKGCACGRGGKGQDALQGDNRGMMSARNTLRVSGRHLTSQQEAGCGGDSRHLSRAAGDQHCRGAAVTVLWVGGPTATPQIGGQDPCLERAISAPLSPVSPKAILFLA